MLFSRKNNQLLARVNFPPYTVHCLTERHVLVAGGGGSAKTGIMNVIEIYELSHDDSGFRARSVAHYETGRKAIMNCAIYNADNFFLIFAGMEGMCQIFKFQLQMEKVTSLPNGISKDLIEGSLKNHCLVKRKRHVKKETGVLEENGRIQNDSVDEHCFQKRSSIGISLNVEPLQSFQTDFSADPFQKLVKFSSDLKVLATAGADGHIRAWKYPEMCKLYEIHAHEDDVDDLDFSPLGDKLISVSRDGHGRIWKSEDGSFVHELQYDLPCKTPVKYIYRGCRYSVVEGSKTNTVVFLTLNPSVRKKPPLPSYLTKWNGTTFTLEKIVSTGFEMLSAIAVSDDGNFIGLGTQEGSVQIYIGFSLQLLYRADHIHSIFVTGLEFLPACEEARRISGGNETSLISISVDNHINVHCIPHRAQIGAFTLLIIFSTFLFAMFLLMDYFSL